MEKLRGIVVDGMFFTFAEYSVYEHEYRNADDQDTYRYQALAAQPYFDPNLHEDYTDIYYDEWLEEVPGEFLL